MEEHTWEQSKENAAPVATGRSISTLAPRAFGTASHENEAKTKKYEKLVRRSEKASEWLCEQSRKLQHNAELTDDQISQLKSRLLQELGYDCTTTDTTHLDFDPLKYWILYIKHIRTSYPSDTQRQFLLMERCTRTFLSTPFLHPQYSNDPRFIRTCILYADKTSSPNDVFKRMNSLKVGYTVALFWVAWAWLAEKRGEYSFCEKIFQKAIRVGAEPKKFLLEREKQFLRRMSRHWLNTSTKNGELDDEEDDGGEGGRGALNSLEERGGVVNRMGGPPTGFPSRSQRENHDSANNNGISSTAGFAIFQDENSPDHNSLDDENRNGGGGFQLTKECEMLKENKMRAEQWNERGYGLNPAAGDGAVGSIVSSRGLGVAAYGAAAAAPTPAFDVFVDEEFEDNDDKRQKAEKNRVDDRSLRQRLDGGTADRIRRDPLRYMNNPSKFASDQAKYEPESSVHHTHTTETKQQIDTKVETKLKPRSGGYDKDLLKGASGEERCFEECRAIARFYKLASIASDYNLLKVQEEPKDLNTSQMDVEESIEEVDMEEEIQCTTQRLKSALKPPSKAIDLNMSVVNPRKVLFGVNTEFPNNESLNASTASSQPNDSFVRDREETINTKFANAEISMMFCSPNNNEIMSEHPGRSFLASTCKKPLFSTNRKKVTASQPTNGEAAGTSFAIFQDDADQSNLNEDCHPASNAMGSFAIYQDDVNNSVLDSKPKGRYKAKFEEDETVTASGLNDMLNSSGLNFKIHSDCQQPPNPSRAARKPNLAPQGDDATASLSDIGALLGNIESCSLKDSKGSSAGFAIFSDENDNVASSGFSIHDENASVSPKKSNGLGFEIFSDENASSTQKKRRIDEPSFGDISRIDDEKTSNFQILDDNAPIAIDYDTKHKRDMESAMRECMASAAKSSCELQIFDYRKKSIPRELLRKSFSSGFSIDLFDGRKVNIIHELGRGVHGVVLLVSNFDEECQYDALKIQAPIGSLAHEFSLLLQLEERVDLDASGFYPFPQPHALYAFSEGGLFIMTAGSNSGMTLLDVVNTCMNSIGSVPEQVAIYYTSRMLRHLESLHRVGKVLHCDVKPDNWVLTRSSHEAGDGSVAGADLMLVDFGRAIDLESVSDNTLFSGSAAAEDSECRAMRQGNPWGLDLDYFGLCASSHILLFGSHMEVVQEKATGKLKLKKLIRRYWQKDLWRRYFDTLLNYDSLEPDDNCLHDLRMLFEEYIDGKGRKGDLESRISTLYTHLPTKR